MLAQAKAERRITRSFRHDPTRGRRGRRRRVVAHHVGARGQRAVSARAARGGQRARATWSARPAFGAPSASPRSRRPARTRSPSSRGVVLGFFIGRSPTLTVAYRPVLAGIFAIPLTLFFPLFVVIFGLGPPSKIAFGALYGFFPIVLNTIAGFSGVDRLFLRSARSQGATRAQTLRHIFLPGAWPIVLAGLRIGFFITFASVLGGETLSSASGVGHQIAHEGDLLESPPMFAWIAIVLTVTIAVEPRADRGRKTCSPQHLGPPRRPRSAGGRSPDCSCCGKRPRACSATRRSSRRRASCCARCPSCSAIRRSPRRSEPRCSRSSRRSCWPSSSARRSERLIGLTTLGRRAFFPFVLAALRVAAGRVAAAGHPDVRARSRQPHRVRVHARRAADHGHHDHRDADGQPAAARRARARKARRRRRCCATSFSRRWSRRSSPACAWRCR